uniref:BTB domain-containing protein n=1 Tax=Romanomermis culicivorax TaxID=13658 RepID=A0A915ICI4_ROMCU
MSYYGENAIISLNVGGTKFTTSKSTLTWIPDSFFTSLLSGRIPTLLDDNGSIFIDRDPNIFGIILNYLRTKQINLKNVDIAALKHEAQFYGLGPLVKRLLLCDELDYSTCGDVIFHAYLPAPPFPPSVVQNSMNGRITATSAANSNDNQQVSISNSSFHSRNLSEPPIVTSQKTTSSILPNDLKFQALMQVEQKPLYLKNENHENYNLVGHQITNNPFAPKVSTVMHHQRSSSHNDCCKPVFKGRSKSRGSTDLTRQIRQELAASLKYQQETFCDPFRVKMIRAHHSWIAVAYHQYVACYRSKDSTGWFLVYVSEKLTSGVERIALNARSGPSSTSSTATASAGNNHGVIPVVVQQQPQQQQLQSPCEKSVGDDGTANRIGIFSLANAAVHALLFIGGQLIALSKGGQVGIWHGVTQNWQVQDVLPISSYDTAGSFLLLGCTNGSIYYIDMQKFPLRMKDNDLLVTELYRDPSSEPITSISVYLTPKSSLCGNWIEIAYGTSSGCVRVIVQHPETVGHGPQLFQTFSVHRASITKVTLTTNHLISVCSEYNHVRTWSVTRFRGMISTQPGSTPSASFKVLTLDPASASAGAGHLAPQGCVQPPSSICNGQSSSSSSASSCSPTSIVTLGAGGPGVITAARYSQNGHLGGDFLLNGAQDVGPFGDQDGEKVFIQKLVPETNQLFVRLSSNGERVCIVKSADETNITCFLVHECEGSSRMGARPRRFLFTGHVNGSIQMWDLTTALDMHNVAKEKGENKASLQGPSPEELLRLIDECEITCSSMSVTPINTPAGSVSHIPSLFTPLSSHSILNPICSTSSNSTSAFNIHDWILDKPLSSVSS